MDYSFVISENKLTISHKHSTQIILFENMKFTGFGKHILFVPPFLFISEPYSKEGGKVWIFQLMQKNPYKKEKTFQVFQQLTRPEKIPNLPGFGSFIFHHEHMLFIIDSFSHNYQGVLYYYYSSSKSQLQILYQHDIEDECLKQILNIETRKTDQFCMTLAVVHRKTGQSRTFTINYIRPKLMSLSRLDKKLAIS